ncbi:MAG: 16S rRNA (cytidine(1402)-2'-O)-methyltransferase [Gemmatimonadetes bacterium]|nr:16S rRNA (cytidine(1402)-2'-O)-methyltransferase [Gemmatimonadota bacterium]
MSSRTDRSVSGKLLVVATPIGNLGDFSPRGREALETCDGIVCEDTRRTGRLLEQLGLPKKPLFSYFAPKEKQQVGPIVKRLLEGRTFALVTDGGTPGVSDPGAVLVAAAHRAGIRVEPIAGPSALVAALSVSSLAGQSFVFEGFLPAKAGARRKRLEELAAETRTIVFYESPHRIGSMLADAADVLGAGRPATIVREATKLHEEVTEGTLEELAERFGEEARGEFVLVVAGGSAEPTDEVALPIDRLLALLQRAGVSADSAARLLAEETGLPRSRLVRRARAAAD